MSPILVMHTPALAAQKGQVQATDKVIVSAAVGYTAVETYGPHMGKHMGHIWGPGLQHMGLFQPMGKKMLPEAQHIGNLWVIFSNIWGPFQTYRGLLKHMGPLSMEQKYMPGDLFNFSLFFFLLFYHLSFVCLFKAGPLDLSFWSILTFLHHGIEEVERHLL